ncbi:MAG: hypothetical protein RLZZ301_1057 [Bacteroidota bacterium]|jgi:hypothetical protein
MQLKQRVFFVLLLIGLHVQVKAQTPVNPTDTTKYIITRTNNVQYIGQIVSDDGREILVLTNELGKLYIPKAEILDIRKVDIVEDYKNGELVGQGVFTTRYQFSTNCFPIKKGENYAMVNLYGPEVHFSVSNRFSVGIMATWIASPLALAFKYSIPTRNEKLHFGLGTLVGNSGYLNQGKAFGGLHWAMATYGNRFTNVTLSFGFCYANSGMKGPTQNFYEPGTYNAVPNAAGGFDFYYPPTITHTAKSSMYKAPVIGLAGIASVGKKASFIWDAMVLMGSVQSNSYMQDQNYYYDPVTSKPSYSVFSAIYPEATLKSTNFLLMPGMRFQRTENRAFQVTLSGVIGHSKMYLNGNSGTGTSPLVSHYSFPMPMVSWFFKF